MVNAQELRIIRVKTRDSAASHDETSVMWWGDCPPAFCSTRHVTTHSSRSLLQYYPNWRQYQYLPLSFGADYASGLTVYIDVRFPSTKITGIVSHGSSDFEFGRTSFGEEESSDGHGVPIHFALSPGEYLTSAWLHMSSRTHGLDGLLAVRSILALDKSGPPY